MRTALQPNNLPAADGACFHCGEPLPATMVYRTLIGGVEQPMCCAGCQAVAEAIVGAGLGTYYERRSSPGRRASRPDDADILRVLNSPAYQRTVVQVSSDAT